MLPKIPLRLIPANLLTAANMSLGFAAVALAFDSKFELSAWLILWSALIDKADGTVAKLMDSQSRFGAEFDSLSDLVSFGVAPAFLFHSYITSTPELAIPWAASFAAALFYALATALRLARFNIMCHNPQSSAAPHRITPENIKTSHNQPDHAPPNTAQSIPLSADSAGSTDATAMDIDNQASDHAANSKTFVGIPSTLAAAIISSSWLVFQDYGYLFSTGSVPGNIYPTFLVMAGILMLSTIKTPKIMRSKSKLFNSFQLLAALVIFTCAVLMVLPIIPFTIAILYIAASLIITVIPDKKQF